MTNETSNRLAISPEGLTRKDRKHVDLYYRIN